MDAALVHRLFAVLVVALSVPALMDRRTFEEAGGWSHPALLLPSLGLSVVAGFWVRMVAGRLVVPVRSRLVRFFQIKRVFEARHAGYERVHVHVDRPGRLAELAEVWALAAC